MKIIVGLGNPLSKYQKTRHNIGYRFLDRLGLNFKNHKKTQSQIAEKNQIIFAKSNKFMNQSGESIKKLLSFFKIKPKNLLIIQDDVDLAFGKIKLSFAKNSAGHKGVESIIQQLKTKAFWRLRIGIEKSDKIPTEKYVSLFHPAGGIGWGEEWGGIMGGVI